MKYMSMALLHVAIILALVGQTTCTAQTKLLRGHDTPATKLEYSSDDDQDVTKLHEEEDIMNLDDEKNEDDVDAKAWKFGQPLHLASGTKVLPPKCPKDVPESGAYFKALVSPHHHVDCDYRHPCSKQGTNLERLNSIRGVLGRMKTLLDGLNVQYAIYAGSAIGQERCEDVLPWDSDCDVAVWEHDIPKIVRRDLDSQYKVRYKSAFIPRTLVDKRTGFYCDIFPMKKKGSTVEFPWPYANSMCPGQAAQFHASTRYKSYLEKKYKASVNKCYKAPYHTVAPFVPCTLNGVQHTCMKDQLAFLKSRYGNGVLYPNVSIAPVNYNPEKIKDNDFEWIFSDP